MQKVPSSLCLEGWFLAILRRWNGLHLPVQREGVRCLSVFVVSSWVTWEAHPILV